MKLMHERGTVFVSTMMSMFLMVLTGAYMYQMAGQGFHQVKQLQTRAQAKYLADAGVSAALGSLKTSWTANNATLASASLGIGSFTAGISTSGGRSRITSTGTVQGITQTATMEVAGPVGSATDYGIASGGNLTIGPLAGQSSVTVNNGSAYSGGNMVLNTNSGTSSITFSNPGLVDAAGTITTSGSGTQTTGAKTPASGTKNFPTVTSAPYLTIAQTNGTYITGDKSYTTVNSMPSPAAGCT